MAYREVSRVEIAEVVRRWQSGESQRQIASGTGLSRKTVRRYIRACTTSPGRSLMSRARCPLSRLNSIARRLAMRTQN